MKHKISNFIWFGVLIAAIIMVGISVWGIMLSTSKHHGDPVFDIGNRFEQPVEVYFNGQKVGHLGSGQNDKFYPNDVLTNDNPVLLIEFKTDSVILFSQSYTWDELIKVLEDQGNNGPYWIGPK